MRPLLLLVSALLLAGCGGADRAADAGKDPRAHFAQLSETPEALPERTEAVPGGRYLVARLERSTWLRSAPGGKTLRRLRTSTEFGSPTVLGVTARRDGWLKVITPRLPNRRAGWILEADARLNATDYALRIDRSAHRLTLERDGRAVRRVTIAVGRPGNETPLGRFAVTDKLRPRDAASPYGCCAIALSGHQTLLEPGWPGGDRLAIHGTPDETSVGQAVSLGCMRAYRDVLRKLLKRVPLGAPVVVRA